MTPEYHFFRFVKKTNTCWIWTGGKTKRQGYGLYHPYRLPTCAAHRYSWFLANGPIPEGLCVLHHCDNPPCVNPDHLFLGTRKTNSDDMVSKGRKPMGGNHKSSVLTNEQVMKIRKEFKERKITTREFYSHWAKIFSVCAGTINKIVYYKSWRHIR